MADLSRRAFLAIALVVLVLAAGGCESMDIGSSPSNLRAAPESAGTSGPAGSVRAAGKSDGGGRTVEVMASGETFQQAREEAVRTALQATVAQLVVSDRLVENSEVVRDDVFATQNGFVTSFEILEQSRSEFGEYELVARVSVSEDTILNYVAYQEGGDSSIDGESLFAEVRRSAGQRDVIQQMFQRFAKGYPWDVVSLELDAVKPVTGHDDRVVASVTAVSDPDYFVAMEQFMKRIARAWYGTSLAFHPGYYRAPTVQSSIRYRKRTDDVRNENGEIQVSTQYPSSQICIASAPSARDVPLLGKVTMGVNADGELRGTCYLFPPGDFFSSFWKLGEDAYGIVDISNGSEIKFLVAFLDDSGRSVVSSSSNRVGDCLLLDEIQASRMYPAPGIYATPRERGQPRSALPFRAFGGFAQTPPTMLFSGIDTSFRIVLRTSEIDLSRAATFRGRPVFGLSGVYERGGEQYIITDIFGEPADLERLCNELIDG